ncbi:MAG: hypothetical protein IPK70_09335 [Flavobacteriales bacterium]|nr:hypothetical protein [Flavobacteriales bacterium]
MASDLGFAAFFKLGDWVFGFGLVAFGAGLLALARDFFATGFFKALATVFGFAFDGFTLFPAEGFFFGGAEGLLEVFFTPLDVEDFFLAIGRCALVG